MASRFRGEPNTLSNPWPKNYLKSNRDTVQENKKVIMQKRTRKDPSFFSSPVRKRITPSTENEQKNSVFSPPFFRLPQKFLLMIILQVERESCYGWKWKGEKIYNRNNRRESRSKGEGEGDAIIIIMIKDGKNSIRGVKNNFVFRSVEGVFQERIL